MKLATLYYRPSAYVLLDGADLVALHECSRAHYDSKCKMMSEPKRAGSPSETEGWIWSQIQWIPSRNEVYGCKDPLAFVQANPELEVEVEVTSHLLDTLKKVLEMSPYIQDLSIAQNAASLAVEFRRLFQQLNDEFKRLNPRPSETADEEPEGSNATS